MTDLDAALADLRARLHRYPAERYPVQHATARFHLGTVLANAGSLDGARRELEVAATLFEGRMPVEHAKTVNQLGAVARQAGQPRAAITAFEHAAAALMDLEQPAEAAAARFNLGLALRDVGDSERALACFRQARDTFAGHGEARAAAAAGRELGAALLARGDIQAAVGELTSARDRAADAGDANGAGAAANALGLAHLAQGRLPEATEAFEQALAAHPRTLRPEQHAMVRANLALVHERAGMPAHARLAARHALALAEAPEAVRAQAREVLDRLGCRRGDVLAVLEAERPERWRPLLVEEALRLAGADEAERRAEADAWADGLLERSERAVELCEAWLAALLEVPPAAFATAVEDATAAIAARPEHDASRLRATVERASARFHVPQALRLDDAFRAAAARTGARWV